ncbi:peptidoglycan DD-metalloendopeptidase family protein [Entomomonas asaccharolytica]|uniref:Peptidoglycan DD-metalloendopeptidase family protein n=1 Tax=Entomomonas asaccharolytica TaxID=2785331 RepID=A0A974RWK5_9GAMM|nr:peptidoglycan DD-metalloendopeptidase family protein [Entomomonas asaccharolytica]QQP85293.1 peptidoglycan DD-metalloendopeptidase family protein [Entomomonas asaccharolytica]
MIQNPSTRKRSFNSLIILIVIAILLGLGILFYPSSEKPQEIETSNTPIAVKDTLPSPPIVVPEVIADIFARSLRKPPTIPLLPAELNDIPTADIAQSKMVIGDGPLIVLPQRNTVLVFKVEKGDTLSTLFNKAGLSANTMYKVIESSNDAKKYFTRINIGQSFEFTLNEAGDLLSLVTKPNLLNTYSLTKQDNGYVFDHNAIEPTYKQVYAYGIITSSLFAAADKAQVPHSMILEIANAFGYDIDFALDLRQGDEFEAIFEQKLVNGKMVGTGNLLAARFINRGKEYTAIRYTNKKGIAAYYRADATSMRRAFIRTPVDFTRISSKFTMGRYHPVLNKIRAHKGVDYAAPTGTAIRASGDGRIVERGWKGGYGNAIVIQHGKTYSTLYGHMSRFAPDLKVGSHVKQSQTIGYVGMTGLATGPHLHYEFRVNGKHVDPLSVKLPMADPLPEKEKARFLALSQPLMAEMRKKKTVLLAKAQTTDHSQTSSE